MPALLYLAGLTCTEETFMVKAGAQRMAAELGLALIAPDTSPRGANVPGEADSWDFGVGAGFYLDATQQPWARHWRMESYLLNELLPLVAAQLPMDGSRLGITGHSMGGHGALTLALRHPGRFRSLSAFAPICAPTQCPWGEKAFTSYLGADRTAWIEYDATVLMQHQPVAPSAATCGLEVPPGLPLTRRGHAALQLRLQRRLLSLHRLQLALSRRQGGLGRRLLQGAQRDKGRPSGGGGT